MQMASIETETFYGDGVYDFHKYGHISLSGINVIDVFEVTSQFEDKLYAISHKFYGTADYTDILAIFNGIKDPLDIPVGMAIKIPESGQLATLIKSSKKTTDGGENTQAAKTGVPHVNNKKTPADNFIKSNGRLVYGKRNNKP